MDKEELIAEEMKKREEIMNHFDKNYLLEAGAGAGKTTIIVQRIINHIISTDIKPSNIVAITFTKAASTELAERIQLKALEYLKSEKDRQVRARLEAIDEIFTGTIHSFCDLILREMPFEAGLSPGYEIIEDAEDFLNEVWYEFIRNTSDKHKDKIDLLWRFNIDYRELRTKAILAMENPDIKFVGYPDLDRDFDSIEKTYNDLKVKYKKLDGSIFKRNSNLGKLLISILEEGPDFSSSIDSILKETPKYGLEVVEAYERLVAKKHLDCGEREDYEDYLEDIFDLYEDLNKLLYNSCTDYINLALAYKEENFRGKLTFNEILYRASQLIKSSDLAKDHFKNKYKYYYIDEFQDTDPMQAELVLHLTDEKEYELGRHWQDCQPRPGSLFVVGDPKQSIYRFRRADISIYNQVKKIIDKNGEVVYLDINFRSSDKICNWVETTFKKEQGGFAFARESSNQQAGFERILSRWDDSPQGIETPPGKNQLSGLYKYREKSQGPGLLAREEEYVAQLVEETLKNYYLVEKRRRESPLEGETDFYNIARDIEPRDIMILTKSNAETGLYLRALKDRDIPALLAGEKTLGDVPEVANLFLLIDALLDYRDQIKLIAALRNSFYLDLDTIDLFLEDNRDLSTLIFKKEIIEKIDHPHLKEAFLYIWELNGLIRNLSPMAFIETIIKKKKGIYNTGRQYSDLESRDAESALIQSMELLKSKSCSSIYEIRNELEKLVNKEVNYELPLNNDFANNAARVMNIHKSKGLEGNIVFLVGREKKTSLGPNSHYVEKDRDNNNLGYMVYKSDFNSLGPEEEDKKEIEAAFKRAENDRLLYVAATRAKSSLVIGSTEDEKMFLNPLARDLVELETDLGQITKKDKALTRKKLEEREYTSILRKRKMIAANSYYKLSPSDFKYQREDMKKFYQDFSSPNFKNLRRDQPKKRFAPRGKIYGTIFHRAMEILIKKNEKLDQLDKPAIDYASRLAIEESLDKLEINKENISLLYPLNSKGVEEVLRANFESGSREAKKIIRERLYGFLHDDLNQLINNEEVKEVFRGAKNIYSELQFSISIEKDKGDLFNKLSGLIKEEDLRKLDKKQALVNGVVDLLIEGEDGSWTIVDYKTDLIQVGNLAEKLSHMYGGQLLGYKILLEEILREKRIEIERLLIYSSYGDQLIAVLAPAKV